MLLNEHNSMPYMKSMAICLNRVIEEGYTEDFKTEECGLRALQHNKLYEPEKINVINFFRFEGQSDPDDNAILYVVETDDGLKGTIIDSYGLYHNSPLSSFMTQVNNFRKKAKN